MSSKSAFSIAIPIAISVLVSGTGAEAAGAEAAGAEAAREDTRGQEREYGRFGLAVKSGAAAGPMGIQLAYNFSRHLQLCAGGGGTSEFLSLLDRSRTDSYFIMGKYYFEHVYFETGYARKTTRAESIDGEKADRRYITEQAIPLHIGYEFGHRLGFYFSTTAGYFHVIGDGGVLVSPRSNPDPKLVRPKRRIRFYGGAVGGLLPVVNAAGSMEGSDEDLREADGDRGDGGIRLLDGRRIHGALRNGPFP